MLQPGSRLRFGVEAPDGRRSTDWAVWATKNADDVYIAGRDLGGHIKISLHQSGRWHHGYTSEAWGEIGDSSELRHLQQWPRPPEIAPGVTLGFRIVVPTTELRPGPSTQSTSRSPVYTVPPPDTHDAVAFETYLINRDVAKFPVDFAMPVGCLRLAGGDVVWVVAHALDLDTGIVSSIQEQVAEARLEASNEDPLPPGVHRRIAVYGFSDDVAQVIEMAVDA